MLTFGSLFSGIGGFDLGFERAGLRCVWQVEKEDYCRKVLRKHWPDVPQWDDVTTFDGEGFERPDVIIGGFPCQDVSLAGRRDGLAGERSGLWREFARIIRTIRPKFVVVENVPGLLAFDKKKGQPAPIATVLTEFSQLGYDAEWDTISARSLGSTQLRRRVFIIANAQGQRGRPRGLSEGQRANREGAIDAKRPSEVDGINANLESGVGRQRAAKDGNHSRERRTPGKPDRRDSPFIGSGWWSSEPSMARMVYGVPRRLVRDSVRGLGNAVVPQVAEVVAHRLLQIHVTLNPKES